MEEDSEKSTWDTVNIVLRRYHVAHDDAKGVM